MGRLPHDSSFRVALFAADEVGQAIARFIARRGFPIACLVIDAKAQEAERLAITEAVRAPKVFCSDELVNPSVIEQLQAAALDLIILAWWPYIIKEPILSIARLGCLNFHPALLPNNRGKHPYFWSIVEGRPFGVSLHFIEAGIDSGPIAFQEEIPVSWEDTGATLFSNGRQAMIELFIANAEAIMSGNIISKPQDNARASFHLARELEGASEVKLDRQYSGRELLNLLRARTGFEKGGCWFRDGQETYEVQVLIKKKS